MDWAGLKLGLDSILAGDLLFDLVAVMGFPVRSGKVG